MVMSSNRLNHFVLFLLFWLQSFAPLLHAHAHEMPASSGIHWHALDVLSDAEQSIGHCDQPTHVGSNGQLITVEQGCRLDQGRSDLPARAEIGHNPVILPARNAIAPSQTPSAAPRPALIASGFLTALQAQAPPART